MAIFNNKLLVITRPGTIIISQLFQGPSLVDQWWEKPVDSINLSCASYLVTWYLHDIWSILVLFIDCTCLNFVHRNLKESELIWGVPKIGVPLNHPFSLINHPFWGTPIFGNLHLEKACVSRFLVLSGLFCACIVSQYVRGFDIVPSIDHWIGLREQLHEDHLMGRTLVEPVSLNTTKLFVWSLDWQTLKNVDDGVRVASARSCRGREVLPGPFFFGLTWQVCFDGEHQINDLVGGLEHEFYDYPYVGNVIIPTDEHIFQRGRYTTNQFSTIFFCREKWGVDASWS